MKKAATRRDEESDRRFRALSNYKMPFHAADAMHSAERQLMGAERQHSATMPNTGHRQAIY